jgi:hypothetical protein
MLMKVSSFNRVEDLYVMQHAAALRYDVGSVPKSANNAKLCDSTVRRKLIGYAEMSLIGLYSWNNVGNLASDVHLHTAFNT